MATTVGSNTPKRIHLLGTGRPEEAIASGAITPGHLIMLDANSKVKVHNHLGGTCECAFALEDALQGKTVDNAYAIADRVFFVLASRGDVVWAYLKAGTAVPAGGFLISAGDGTLRPDSGSEGGQEQRVACALETVDATDSNDQNERIRVRIL